MANSRKLEKSTVQRQSYIQLSLNQPWMNNSRFCAGPNPGDHNSTFHQGKVSAQFYLRTCTDYRRHLKSQPANKTWIRLTMSC